jgi:NTP pyrophosphatase (non-canonical NTP hydrolase)
MKENLINNLYCENSLDLIEKYVVENINTENIKKEDASREMFKLFFGVVELGKEIRISLKSNDLKNTETKITDIFLTLISICNSLNIDLFAALKEKEEPCSINL